MGANERGLDLFCGVAARKIRPNTVVASSGAKEKKYTAMNRLNREKQIQMTEALGPYIDSVEAAFGARAEYAKLIKTDSTQTVEEGVGMPHQTS